ncbi:chaperonin 10-like protein [Mariannaea sp. PMI_226]|nr:chaperonin 10-like protein [Mariannaea sp. PMI_226]
MPQTARALVASAKDGPLQFKDVVLESPRPDEVLIEVHASGICHGDIACITGKIPVPFPIVLGHEGTGVVKEVGSEVRGIEAGDSVIASFNACKSCDLCLRGVPAYCQNFLPLNFGGSRLDGSVTMSAAGDKRQPIQSNFFGQSTFASFAIVNACCLVKLPEKAPLALYAPLGCAMLTGAGALLNTLNMPRGASVAVFGTGSVGMAAIMAAKIQGSRIIIGVDIDEGRLEIAKSLGATHILKTSGPEVVDQIKAICDGDGVQYAVDCTGVPVVVERMIKALGNAGKAASCGAAPPGTKVSVDIFEHITRGKQYFGCNLGDSIPQQIIPFLIKQHSEGNFPLERIVKTYNIDDWELALEDMHSGTVIKPVLVWRE